MRHPLFGVVEKKYSRTSALEFEIGDTVAVTTRIVEGDKERLQDFEGTLIGRRGRGLDESITVRRLVGNEGVERVFPVHSPKVMSVRVVRSGVVRRCKLYYLRQRVGKARKLRERRMSAETRKAVAAARAAREAGAAEVQEAVAAGRPAELAGAR